MQYEQKITRLKGFGIILVVLGHAILSNKNGYTLRNFIYSFHLAIFYFATGYLYKEKYKIEIKSYCLKRLRSLYIPYVGYGLFFLLLHNLFCIIGLYHLSNSYSFGMMVDNAFNLIKFNYFEPLSGTFWFFKSLFIVSTIFEISIYFVHKYFIHEKVAFAGIILCLTILGFSGIYFVYPGHKTISNLSLLPFMYIGHLIYIFKDKIKYKTSLAFVAFIVIVFYSNNVIEINSMSIGQNPFVFYLCGICGVYMILTIASKVPSKNYLDNIIVYVGKKTEPIFIWHLLCFRIVSLLIIFFYGLNSSLLAKHPIIEINNDVWWLVYLAVGIVGSLIIERLIYLFQFFILKIFRHE